LICTEIELVLVWKVESVGIQDNYVVRDGKHQFTWEVRNTLRRGGRKLLQILRNSEDHLRS